MSKAEIWGQIRSIYRLVEFGLGIDGYPFRHEWPFYTLEALPMLPAISTFCLWYPGRYMPKKKFVDELGDTESKTVQR
jgi:hypothetical protein